MAYREIELEDYVQLFLTKPAIVSSLGEGLEHHIKALLNEVESPLYASDKLFRESGLKDKSAMVGEVALSLRPFPDDLPRAHRSRNNQLLWHSLVQIEDRIERAIRRFGKQRVAVVIGTSTTGVDENLPVFQYAARHNDWSGVPFNQQQQYFSAAADFIAYQYGLSGICYGISTACTSGAKALISAARLLKANLCDAVICGGVDTLSLLTLVGFHSLSVLSTQPTNPFSANRNGINLGEGAAVFVMSREALDESSVALLGYGTSSDAYHMSSPHPAGEGAISAFSTALKSAKLTADQIGWINLHGTGTFHNDQMEAIAVKHIFGSQTPCSTTKPYTGHTLGAAGAIEAAILWGVIAPQTNPSGKLPAQRWDNQADEVTAQIHLTTRNDYWPYGHRIGASSSFAFGGNNTVLILGEADD